MCVSVLKVELLINDEFKALNLKKKIVLEVKVEKRTDMLLMWGTRSSGWIFLSRIIPTPPRLRRLYGAFTNPFPYICSSTISLLRLAERALRQETARLLLPFILKNKNTIRQIATISEYPSEFWILWRHLRMSNNHTHNLVPATTPVVFNNIE